MNIQIAHEDAFSKSLTARGGIGARQANGRMEDFRPKKPRYFNLADVQAAYVGQTAPQHGRNAHQKTVTLWLHRHEDGSLARRMSDKGKKLFGDAVKPFNINAAGAGFYTMTVTLAVAVGFLKWNGDWA